MSVFRLLLPTALLASAAASVSGAASSDAATFSRSAASSARHGPSDAEPLQPRPSAPYLSAPRAPPLASESDVDQVLPRAQSERKRSVGGRPPDVSEEEALLVSDQESSKSSPRSSGSKRSVPDEDGDGAGPEANFLITLAALGLIPGNTIYTGSEIVTECQICMQDLDDAWRVLGGYASCGGCGSGRGDAPRDQRGHAGRVCRSCHHRMLQHEFEAQAEVAGHHFSQENALNLLHLINPRERLASSNPSASVRDADSRRQGSKRMVTRLGKKYRLLKTGNRSLVRGDDVGDQNGRQPSQGENDPTPTTIARQPTNSPRRRRDMHGTNRCWPRRTYKMARRMWRRAKTRSSLMLRRLLVKACREIRLIGQSLQFFAAALLDDHDEQFAPGAAVRGARPDHQNQDQVLRLRGGGGGHGPAPANGTNRNPRPSRTARSSVLCPRCNQFLDLGLRRDYYYVGGSGSGCSEAVLKKISAIRNTVRELCAEKVWKAVEQSESLAGCSPRSPQGVAGGSDSSCTSKASSSSSSSATSEAAVKNIWRSKFESEALKRVVKSLRPIVQKMAVENLPQTTDWFAEKKTGSRARKCGSSRPSSSPASGKNFRSGSSGEAQKGPQTDRNEERRDGFFTDAPFCTADACGGSNSKWVRVHLRRGTRGRSTAASLSGLPGPSDCSRLPRWVPGGSSSLACLFSCAESVAVSARSRGGPALAAPTKSVLPYCAGPAAHGEPYVVSSPAADSPMSRRDLCSDPAEDGARLIITGDSGARHVILSAADTLDEENLLLRGHCPCAPAKVRQRTWAAAASKEARAFLHRTQRSAKQKARRAERRFARAVWELTGLTEETPLRTVLKEEFAQKEGSMLREVAVYKLLQVLSGLLRLLAVALVCVANVSSFWAVFLLVGRTVGVALSGIEQGVLNLTTEGGGYWGDNLSHIGSGTSVRDDPLATTLAVRLGAESEEREGLWMKLSNRKAMLDEEADDADIGAAGADRRLGGCKPEFSWLQFHEEFAASPSEETERANCSSPCGSPCCFGRGDVQSEVSSGSFQQEKKAADEGNQAYRNAPTPKTSSAASLRDSPSAPPTADRWTAKEPRQRGHHSSTQRRDPPATIGALAVAEFAESLRQQFLGETPLPSYDSFLHSILYYFVRLSGALFLHRVGDNADRFSRTRGSSTLHFLLDRNRVNRRALARVLRHAAKGKYHAGVFKASSKVRRALKRMRALRKRKAARTGGRRVVEQAASAVEGSRVCASSTKNPIGAPEQEREDGESNGNPLLAFLGESMGWACSDVPLPSRRSRGFLGKKDGSIHIDDGAQGGASEQEDGFSSSTETELDTTSDDEEGTNLREFLENEQEFLSRSDFLEAAKQFFDQLLSEAQSAGATAVEEEDRGDSFAEDEKKILADAVDEIRAFLRTYRDVDEEQVDEILRLLRREHCVYSADPGNFMWKKVQGNKCQCGGCGCASALHQEECATYFTKHDAELDSLCREVSQLTLLSPGGGTLINTSEESSRREIFKKRSRGIREDGCSWG